MKFLIFAALFVTFALCSESDPCAGLVCPEHAVCSAQGDQCHATCQSGRLFDSKTSTCIPNPCNGITCPPNAECSPMGGECRGNCVAGFVSKNNECVRDTDACTGKPCIDNADCRADGESCVATCKEGFLPFQDKLCVADPCKGVITPDNGSIRAVAIKSAEDKFDLSCRLFCAEGFTVDAATKRCSRNSICAAIQCPKHARCINSNDSCVISCEQGFTFNGDACVPAN